MKFISCLIFLSLVGMFGNLWAQEDLSRLGVNDLSPPTKEDLINLDVAIASKKEEFIYDAPGIISVVTSKEIQRFGANNLTEVLERVASVYIIGTYFTPRNIISFRGDSNNTPYNTHVLLLINGRPTREILFGGIDYPILLSFPIALIDRLEVIRGPGSVLYGTNAYTGVVNIITKKGFDDATHLELKYGSFGTAAFEAMNTKTKDDLQISTALKYFNQNGWNYRAFGEPSEAIETNPNDTLDFRSGQTNLGAMLSASYKKFTLNSFVNYSAQNHTGVLPVLRYPDTDGSGRGPVQPFRNRQIETLRAFLDLGHEFNYWKDKARLTLNSTLNLTNTRFSNPSGEVDGIARDGLIEATQFINFSNKLSFILGGTVNLQSGKIEIGDDEARGLSSFFEDWYSAYTQIEYRPTEDIELFAGGQWNKPAGIPSDFVPRLGAIFHITPRIGAKLLYGEAFRAPFQAEQTYSDPGVLVGTQGLRPEKIQTAEAQVFYRSSNAYLSLNYFNNRQKDLITRFRQAGTGTTYANDIGLNVQGLELEGKLAITEELFLLGSVTWQDTRNGAESGQALAQLRPVSLMPQILAKAGVFYEWRESIQIGIFDSYFGDAQQAESINPVNPIQRVNPPADAFHFITLKMDFNLDNLLKLTKIKQERLKSSDRLVLSIYATNLGNAQIFYPEFIRREINTLPGRGGNAFYGAIKLNF